MVIVEQGSKEEAWKPEVLGRMGSWLSCLQDGVGEPHQAEVAVGMQEGSGSP